MTDRYQSKGFTIIELMFTVAIAAILMMIAAPSFDQIIRNNRVSTETNKLASAIQEARTEAVKRGTTITLCRSTDYLNCTITGTGKLLIFIDTAASSTDAPIIPGETDTAILRKIDALPDTIQLVSNVTYIRFNNLGLPVNLGGTQSIRIEDEECASGEEKAKEIAITEGGQISLEKTNCADDS